MGLDPKTGQRYGRQADTPRPLTAADFIALLRDKTQGPAIKAALLDELGPEIVEIVQITINEGIDDERTPKGKDQASRPSETEGYDEWEAKRAAGGGEDESPVAD
jgi:hypothetical protein